MAEQYIHLPWEQPGWLEEATEWLHAQLRNGGLNATGPVEMLHQRAWSAFARVPTSSGTVYFKAPAPMYGYEAPLTQALARWRPDCSVPILAVDQGRGWILSMDAGTTLREAVPTTEQVEHWPGLLTLYADLQKEMAGRVPELLSFAVPDRRLARLPHLYDELMEEDSLRVGLEPGLTQEEYRRLRELRPQLLDWCDELASYGLPETLTHEEVHDANVLVHGERYIFTDWSDCSVAHPFFSILVIMRAAAFRLKLPEEGPEITRIRDAYLEPWTTVATWAELLRACALGYKLGMLNRALSWHHGTGRLAPEHSEPYADSVPGWLQDFLNEEMPLPA